MLTPLMADTLVMMAKMKNRNRACGFSDAFTAEEIYAQRYAAKGKQKK